MFSNSYTTFTFKFTGSKKQFFQKITKWATTTDVGKKYQTEDNPFTLQRGRRIFQFFLTVESSSLLDVLVIGFAKGDHPALILCIPCTCWFGEYPGLKPNKALCPPHKGLLPGPERRGWDHMMNLFDFLEVTDYQTEEKRGVFNGSVSNSQGPTITDR
ncbi:MAG: hypothetical protein JSW11_10440 [Candidatus Heimdallarchaeota archaeon]|nr:MAG: hypothetical protein JSW11_10440 [Candidatus Heimdallarchaeota archaeon]